MEPRIVLVGEESSGMRLLRALHRRGCDIACVLSDGPVRRVAAELGYEVRPADCVKDPSFADDIAGTDLLFNAHSLHIIAPEVLAAPSGGCLNVHPGPLPEYAGLNTPCWALYEGAAEYGVTVHWMVPDIDAGPIASQRRWPLSEDETALKLWSRCTREGVELALDLVSRIAEGRELPACPQDLSGRRYYGAGPPRDGRISWDMPAEEIARFVRACAFGPFQSPWGRPVAPLHGRPVTVLQATVLTDSCGEEPGTAVRLPDGAFRVAAPDGWVRVEVRSGRRSGAG